MPIVPNMPDVPTKVVVFGYPPRDPYLDFRLIFADGYEKYYSLDAYQIKAFRASERDIIEHCAREYYEQVGYGPVNIQLIFL